MLRRCPFDGCGQEISHTLFACPRHWRGISAANQAEIHAAYRDYLQNKIDLHELRRRQRVVLDQEQGRASKTATCKSCGAPVFFKPHATTGALMIFNAQPDPKGLWAIVGGRAVHANNLFEQPAEDERYADHHATCPNAAKHRKRK